MRMRLAATIALSLLTGACTTPRAPRTDEWVAAVVAADHLFGGGTGFGHRLAAAPTLAPAGDPRQRAAFLDAMRRRHDEQAAALVLELTDEATARSAIQFLSTDAGNALIAAEDLALGCASWYPDSFPGDAAAVFADRAHVGDDARRRIAATGAALARGESGSPAVLALQIGAARLLPEHAGAIASFYRSATGQRWLDVRTRAYAASTPIYRAFVDEALHRGFAQSLDGPPLPDLILPPATYK